MSSMSGSATKDASVYVGDELLPDANMIYDNRSRIIHAPTAAVWPWILQIGKERDGRYLPSSMERLIPRNWRAERKIRPDWQKLAVGDLVNDYGFNAKEDVFQVAILEEAKALVFTSQRYGASFTWALLLESSTAQDSSEGVVVYLRFRGQTARTGWQLKVLVTGGHFMDWATTQPMLAGLAERAETTWMSMQALSESGGRDEVLGNDMDG